jgi:hypothetical protein
MHQKNICHENDNVQQQSAICFGEEDGFEVCGRGGFTTTLVWGFPLSHRKGSYPQIMQITKNH